MVGKPHRLLDGAAKVTGRTDYAGDLVLPNMLHAGLVLSPYARARVLNIDVAPAQAVPGVVAVLGEEDLPSHGHRITTRPTAVLAGDRVRYAGQPVAIVIAESAAAAAGAAQLVAVDYEVEVPVLDPASAVAPDSALVWPEGLQAAGTASLHAAVGTTGGPDDRVAGNVANRVHLSRGDVSGEMAAAAVVIDRHYSTSGVHQAYLEPHAALADYDAAHGLLTVYTSTQGPFLVRDLLSDLLGLPAADINIVPKTVGGGFGAKYGIIEPLAAGASMVVGRPVRLVLSRNEDFLTTTPAPACRIHLRLGVGASGQLALWARVLIDNGALPVDPDGIGGIIGVLLGGYYSFTSLDIECLDVLTNKQPAGAYRAPGGPPATFAIESAMDEAACALGQDPLEFRLDRVAGPGSPMGNGRPWPSLGAAECLRRLARHRSRSCRSGRYGEGVGVALACWPGAVSPAAAVCKVGVDGTVRIELGSVDVSGAHGSLALVAAEVLGVGAELVEVPAVDTDRAPIGPPAGGSQTTYSVAGAVREAAVAARAQLLEVASDHLELAVDDLELAEGRVRVKGAPVRSLSLGEVATLAESSPGGREVAGHGRSSLDTTAPGAAAHLARVRVDFQTGAVEVVDYVAVQDVGLALNPTLVAGQIHGGVAQGIGWGLHEAVGHDAAGQLQSATFVDYAVPAIDSVPGVCAELVENPSPLGLHGARLVGEPPVMPGAAAIANAIADAAGVRITGLPITPEAVWSALDCARRQD